MLDSYTVHRRSKDKGDETITYDISETVQKIRTRYKELNK